MDNPLHEKLLRLAFDPAATEGEAVNAFLIYRRQNGKIPMLTAPKVEKFKSSWNITLDAKHFDGFIQALSTWQPAPYYTIHPVYSRTRLTERWKISLHVEFGTQLELNNFRRYLDRAFALIIA